ncbi:hypothetical protein NBRC110019_07620 [Neptunitalea chrysea]|uniref:Uncharacterized protein n=1 Tax=Neptunitalea chrysea TaxID=1647581 RepID=A0A9W6B397_9FLAO|nr:hypothetical protein [Neptunitalea chrysea]GLB51723.1 hypothetical protein NBRC110019_07620 [Neptunitalea chrysea]
MSYFVQYKNIINGNVIFEEKIDNSSEIPQKTCKWYLNTTENGFVVEDISYYAQQPQAQTHNGYYAIVWLKEINN